MEDAVLPAAGKKGNIILGLMPLINAQAFYLTRDKRKKNDKLPSGWSGSLGSRYRSFNFIKCSNKIFQLH